MDNQDFANAIIYMCIADRLQFRIEYLDDDYGAILTAGHEILFWHQANRIKYHVAVSNTEIDVLDGDFDAAFGDFDVETLNKVMDTILQAISK